MRLNTRVIDIGCGTGALCRDLYVRGFKVLGVDTSPVAVEIAMRRISPKVPSALLSYRRIYENRKLPTLEIADVVFCVLTYQFIKNKDWFISQIHSSCHPGGYVIIAVPLVRYGARISISATPTEVDYLRAALPLVEEWRDGTLLVLVFRASRR